MVLTSQVGVAASYAVSGITKFLMKRHSPVFVVTLSFVLGDVSLANARLRLRGAPGLTVLGENFTATDIVFSAVTLFDVALVQVGRKK